MGNNCSKCIVSQKNSQKCIDRPQEVTLIKTEQEQVTSIEKASCCWYCYFKKASGFAAYNLNMNSQIQKYKKYHKHPLNRILHIVTLFEIPYSLYLIKKKKYYKSVIYYIFFNHFITWFFGHVLIEKNGLDVRKHFLNGIKNKELDTFLFFTIFTPPLRIIDFLNYFKML
jgi:hypothetical protein